MYEGAVKRLDFMCSSKGWQQTFGLMPKNRAYSLDFPREAGHKVSKIEESTS